MATEFTVIFSVRQHFGDQKGEVGEWYGYEPSAPFVGAAAAYDFKCPYVDRSEPAVLLFQSIGVTHDQNVLRINGIDIYNGMSAGPQYLGVHVAEGSFGGPPAKYSPLWKSNTLVVQANVLLDSNTLFIESSENRDGKRDDFIIDNMVIFYKRRLDVGTASDPTKVSDRASRPSKSAR